MFQPSRTADARGDSPLTVRNGITTSAVLIFAHLFAFLVPKTFFARDGQSAPALYWVTMPIRLLVYPVCFIFQACAAVLLTLLCSLLVVACAPLIWWAAPRGDHRHLSHSGAYSPLTCGRVAARSAGYSAVIAPQRSGMTT